MWLEFCKLTALIFSPAMKNLVRILAVAPALFMGLGLSSAAQDFDVFTPIAKYIRMGDADSALRLFASDDAGEVYDLACKLNEYNLERQQACDEVYRSAKEMIAREGPFRNVIMLCGEEWSTWSSMSSTKCSRRC